MKSNSRIQKKSYAMQRMARAIDRAVRAGNGKEKERAARWAGAWGMLCGIRSATVRLRRAELVERGDDRLRQPSAPIEISSQAVSVPETDSVASRSSTGRTPPQRGSEFTAAGIFDSTGPSSLENSADATRTDSLGA